MTESILFIHSSLDIHLRFLPYIGYYLKCAIYIRYIYVFKLVLSFSSCIYPLVELLNCMLVHTLVLVVEEWGMGSWCLFSKESACNIRDTDLIPEWEDSLEEEIATHSSFPDRSLGKEFACNAGDPGSIPGLGRSHGEGIGYPLQYSWASCGIIW